MSSVYTFFFFFFFNDTATTEIYTLSLHDALPISRLHGPRDPRPADPAGPRATIPRQPRGPGLSCDVARVPDGALGVRRRDPRPLRVAARGPGRERRDEMRARTVGELRASGWQVKSVKQELRDNLIARLQRGEPLFPGIVGYDESVVPQSCPRSRTQFSPARTSSSSASAARPRRAWRASW